MARSGSRGRLSRWLFPALVLAALGSRAVEARRHRHVRTHPTAAAPTAPAPSSAPAPAPSSAPAASGNAAAPAPAPSPASVEASPHLLLGLPRDAHPDDERLLDEGELVVSYDPARRVANWVAWRLTDRDVGDVARRRHFDVDPLLPGSVPRATPADYERSGYDRGHLCPAADRSSSVAASTITFRMTNVQPQLHELNTGPWERLEAYTRKLVRRRGRVAYVVAGGIFGASPPTIGGGVAVPRAAYKIIVEAREGQGPLDLTADTRVIAVIMPNEPGVGARRWESFETSVDRIEAETGYDFLARLPDPVEAALEAEIGDGR